MQKYKQPIVMSGLLFFIGIHSACADTLPINNFQLMQNISEMGIIIQDISIMVGLSIFFSGLFRLKRYGEMRTFMSHQMTIAKPLLMLISGIAILCLPVMLRTTLLALWSTSNPMQYTQVTTSSFELLIPPIIGFVRIIGVVAFVRGWVLISRCGGEQTQPGTVGKSLMHILGGILCVNIVATTHLLRAIFGLS